MESRAEKIMSFFLIFYYMKPLHFHLAEKFLFFTGFFKMRFYMQHLRLVTKLIKLLQEVIFSLKICCLRTFVIVQYSVEILFARLYLHQRTKYKQLYMKVTNIYF